MGTSLGSQKDKCNNRSQLEYWRAQQRQVVVPLVIQKYNRLQEWWLHTHGEQQMSDPVHLTIVTLQVMWQCDRFLVLNVCLSYIQSLLCDYPKNNCDQKDDY